VHFCNTYYGAEQFTVILWIIVIARMLSTGGRLCGAFVCESQCTMNRAEQSEFTVKM